MAAASSRGREVRSRLVFLSGDYHLKFFVFFLFQYDDGEWGIWFGMGLWSVRYVSGDVETPHVNIISSSSVETVVRTGMKALYEGCGDYGCKGRTACRTVTVPANEHARLRRGRRRSTPGLLASV